MNSLFAFFSAVLFSSLAVAQEIPSVKYKDLIGIQESIKIESVLLVGIEKVSRDIGGYNSTTIKLYIRGMSACGESFFVDGRSGVLQFFQVGPLGFHIQPGCNETIEYYWTPVDYSLEEGKSNTLLLRIGPSYDWKQPAKTDAYFTVSVTATKRVGALPNGNGYGHYFEYSDLKLIGPQ